MFACFFASFGDIYSRPGLNLKSREIAVVAVLTALGTDQRWWTALNLQNAEEYAVCPLVKIYYKMGYDYFCGPDQI